MLSGLKPVGQGKTCPIDVELTPPVDVSDIAKAVNAAPTPHKNQDPPGVLVPLSVPDLDEELVAKIAATLKNLKRLDAAGSSCDIKGKVVRVRLAAKNPATLSYIEGAFEAVGITAKPIEPKAAEQ